MLRRHRDLRWKLTVMLTLTLAAPAGAQDPSDLLTEGRRAFEREDFDAAREALWKYLDATANLTGAARLPQAEALHYIARMEPDAAVARQHYEIIVDEFPAASVADEALYRLGMLELESGRPEAARARFDRLQQQYPFSRLQPELPLWIGRTEMAAGDPAGAARTFEAGFRRVRSQDLPRELSRPQAEALAAEYAHWIATAHYDAGDEQSAAQYYTLLTLDYPESPQAVEARETLATIGGEPLGNPSVPTVAPDAPAVAPDTPTTVADTPPPPEAGPPEGEEIEVAVADPSRDAPRAGGAAEPVVPTPESARVEPEPAREAPVDPAPRPARADEPPAKFAPAEGAQFFVQVGAFESASRAADLSKRLKADGFENTTIQVAVVDGKGFYRVRIGPFRPGSDDARRADATDRLRARGYPAEQVTGE